MSDSAHRASSLDSSTPFGGIYLRVTPEPEPEEMAAIAAAIHVLQEVTRATPDVSNRTAVSISRWARAGRLEAMRDLSGGTEDLA